MALNAHLFLGKISSTINHQVWGITCTRTSHCINKSTLVNAKPCPSWVLRV
ncbi:hypothetical protein [Moraxella lacunata]|uniref:hypothetical protein n=1 Tax=Moraxella lacunata TaxID=477 RepID=UPI003EE268A8